MKVVKSKKLCFEDFHVQFNEASIAQLFNNYEKVGFLYPEKKALLAPHFSTITKNWKTLLNSQEDLLWILTKEETDNNKFSSVSIVKQNNHGYLAQHLVSNGNPFMSLSVLLAAQFKAEHHFTKEGLNSSQNWFRPNNRYAYRVFASMYDKLGSKNAFLRLFNYLTLALDQIEPISSPIYEAEPVTGIDQEFIQFIRAQYGDVFIEAEELDQKDILLENLNNIFKKYNLQRYRRVLKFRCTKTSKIIASAIINRAPIGTNFSFLENRCYYILDPNLSELERFNLLKVMNVAVKDYYQEFALKAIPIVTDVVTSKTLQVLKANFLREYMQSIWLRNGFSLWFDHIYSFLQKIEGRMRLKKAS